MTRNKTSRLARIGLGLSLGVAGTVVHADPNPYYLGGSLGVTRVSNVYRTSTDENSDTVTTASLLAGVDQQIGRQHLTADATLQQNRYATNDILNNNGYTLRSNLDWATAGRISGTLSASATRQLANYNAAGVSQPVFEKNIENDRRYQALIRIGLVTRWSAEASYTHNSQEFSLIEYSALNFSQNAGSLGLVYRPSDLLRLGLAFRHTEGEYPQYPLSIGGGVFSFYVDDTFKRNDVDFTGTWQPTGSSNVTTRLSWTNNRHDPAESLSYRGLTGSLGWNYSPGGRWTFSAQLTRDTGEQATLLGPSQNRVGNSVQLNTSYDLTSKIALTGSASARRGTYRSITDAPDAFDNDHSVSLGTRFAYSRSLSLSCQAYRTGRSSSVSYNNFNATGVGCTAQALVY
ncbi:hypothetical protein SNE35_04965 [Paucibacter sp. R3-3]|uniref:Beta-barrel porin 2 n=1 Tax=Roseateles agri TaxID=3098619 RepID=A0ABU5DC33_9BURK|nr:hypothetical protein [Paucibacter sp. R3-3]MDY0743841.1 hypothetical protein [Paucibacter sp. R3-3]